MMNDMFPIMFLCVGMMAFISLSIAFTEDKDISNAPIIADCILELGIDKDSCALLVENGKYPKENKDENIH